MMKPQSKTKSNNQFDDVIFNCCALEILMLVSHDSFFFITKLHLRHYVMVLYIYIYIYVYIYIYIYIYVCVIIYIIILLLPIIIFSNSMYIERMSQT